jgi:hypothetical protein
LQFGRRELVRADFQCEMSGKTVDMPFIASRGISVVGVEGASRAVNEYFAESASKSPTKKIIGKFQAHFTDDSPAVELWHGDLFELEPGSAVRLRQASNAVATVLRSFEMHAAEFESRSRTRSRENCFQSL